MKIASSTIAQSSSYQYSSATVVSQSAALTTMSGTGTGTAAALTASTSSKTSVSLQSDTVTLSGGQGWDNAAEAYERAQVKADAQQEAAKGLGRQNRGHGVRSAQRTGKCAIPQDPLELKLSLLREMLRMLTGKEYDFKPLELKPMSPQQPTQLGTSSTQFTLETEETASMSINMQSGGQLQPVGRAMLQTTQTTAFYEYEATSFSAQGVVQTADGRTIALDLELNMSREFMAYSQTSVTHTFTDPLVINYGGTAASLTSSKFTFDLDADGTTEQISFAGQGSGFLALDKNGDGVINDGTELFGTQSGNGFADLRAYDDDGNGWIDENDDIFSQLRVWVKDEQGNDQLFSLLEADVGAIFLSAASTQFTLGNSFEADGQVRSTGVFLKESGGVGTVQQIDLVV